MEFDVADYSPRDLATSRHWLTEMLDGMIDSASTLPTSVAEIRATIAAIDAATPDPALVEAALLGLAALGRDLHDAGAGAPTQTGTVTGLFRSDGGVPKVAVEHDAVTVGFRGLDGDRQANRKHHGRPFQAVCLWSSEVIDALVAEGHPIAGGLAGENITVAGIDWTTLRPGVRILVGDVLLEISGWATPCRKNDQWFLDRSDRIDHDQHPGWSRAYAWVRRPGAVARHDAVVVEPDTRP